MKRNVLFVFLLLPAIFLLAQTPEAVNYQTAVRDSEGQPLANTALSIKMTIRSEAVDGDAIFIETHQVVTNSLGLVNILLGKGAPEMGVFSKIRWDISEYFLEVAVDTQGGGVYQVLGVSQFLSVPYCFYTKSSQVAAGIPPMTTEERNNIDNPFIGQQIYNTETRCLNYYSGTTWYALCGECNPPNQANAGPDLSDVTTNPVTLAANKPENGIGAVINGSENQTDNNLFEKYCYQNDNLNCSVYGGLYQWEEAMNYTVASGSQGICPGGWHIPADSEWTELETYLGGTDIAGGKLKEAGFDHWIEPNTGATNLSGFTALPGSSRGSGGSVGIPGYTGDWWSSTTLYDPSLVWYQYLYYSHGISSRYSETRDNGFSVRCLKNESTIY